MSSLNSSWKVLLYGENKTKKLNVLMANIIRYLIIDLFENCINLPSLRDLLMIWLWF